MPTASARAAPSAANRDHQPVGGGSRMATAFGVARMRAGRSQRRQTALPRKPALRRKGRRARRVGPRLAFVPARASRASCRGMLRARVDGHRRCSVCVIPAANAVQEVSLAPGVSRGKPSERSSCSLPARPAANELLRKGPQPTSVPHVHSRSTSDRATGRPPDSGPVIGQPIGRSTLRRDGFPHTTSGVRLGRRTGHCRRDLRRGRARPYRSAADDSAHVAGVRRRRPARVPRGWPERRPRTCTPRGAACPRRLTLWPTRAQTATVACLDGSTAASSDLKRPPGGCDRLRIQPLPGRRDRRSMVRGKCRCIPKI